MPPKTAIRLTAFLIAMIVVVPLRGQEPASQPTASAVPGSAAFLFVYRVKPGLQTQFEQGYRQHLDWHRRNQDPLPWYGWYIANGPRVGLFVNGTFGIPFKAMDQRVNPSDDAADLAKTAGPFSDPVDRVTYRIRPELSTSTPLESRSPHPAVDAIEVIVQPGSERFFEDTLQRARGASQQEEGRPGFACYQLVAGGELPAYLIIIGRRGWETYDAAPGSALDAILGSSLADARRQGEKLRGHIAHIRSETWTFRSDLTLLPSPTPVVR